MSSVRWTEEQLREHLTRPRPPLQLPPPAGQTHLKQRLAPTTSTSAPACWGPISVLTLRLGFLVPSANTWHRLHWASCARWSKRVRVELAPQIPPNWVPLARARVVTTRHSRVRPDDDNLSVALKPILDSLRAPCRRWPKGLAVVLDDDPGGLVSEPHWSHTPGIGFVTIEVHSLDSGDGD